LLCDVQFQSLVLGVFADWDKPFGDLDSTVGADHKIAVGGRAGISIGSAMPYAHLEWLQARGAFGHVDGLGYGLGMEVRLGVAPVALDFRWTHEDYENVLGSGMDVSADVFKGSLVYKLNFFK